MYVNSRDFLHPVFSGGAQGKNQGERSLLGCMNPEDKGEGQKEGRKPVGKAYCVA